MVKNGRGPTLTLAQVMEQHPQLNRFGMGAFDEGRKTPEQRETYIAAERAILVAKEATVLRVAAWLSENIAPIKTPRVGSYQMKHVVERAIGEYVANGELIAAALIAGYPFKYSGGPNVDFGMSKRDVDQASSRT